jgi:hypothetical protein
MKLNLTGFKNLSDFELACSALVVYNIFSDCN